jgi:hypothetical protein
MIHPANVLWIGNFGRQPSGKCRGGIQGSFIARDAPSMHERNVRHTTLKAARIRNIDCTTKIEWDRIVQLCSRQSRFARRDCDPARHKRMHRQYRTMDSQTKVSHLAHLQTGHCFLNSYLHWFNVCDTPPCNCESGATETMDHHLLLCSRYNRD